MPDSPDNFATTLLASMPDAVVYSDAEGLIRFWNQGAIRIFGFSASDALGASLDIIIPVSLRDRHWQVYHETMRTGVTRYGEGQLISVPALRKDGTRISVEFTIVPFTDAQGRMTGIASIMRDATARFDEMRALRKRIAELEAPRTPSA